MLLNFCPIFSSTKLVFLMTSFFYKRFGVPSEFVIQKEKRPIVICGFVLLIIVIVCIIIIATSTRNPKNGSKAQNEKLQKILLIGGQTKVGSRDVLSSTESYVPNQNPTSQNDFDTTLLTGRRWHAAGVLGRKIIITGGRNRYDTHLRSTEIFDPSNNSWTVGPDMNTRRHAPTGVVLHDTFYVCGGEDGSYNYLKTCEFYTLSTNTWSSNIRPMARGTYTSAAVALNGKMYVIGGSNGGLTSNRLESYDRMRNIWQRKAPMNHARNQLSATVYRGNIIACGGEGRIGVDLDVCEEYNPDSDTWRQFPSLNFKRDDHALVNLAGIMYILGGEKTTPDWPVGDSVEVYDPVRKVWKETNKMLSKREDFVSVVY